MFYQIFFLPLVKRSVIITNKHGVYELPDKFFIYLFIYFLHTLFQFGLTITPIQNNCRTTTLSYPYMPPLEQ